MLRFWKGRKSKGNCYIFIIWRFENCNWKAAGANLKELEKNPKRIRKEFERSSERKSETRMQRSNALAHVQNCITNCIFLKKKFEQRERLQIDTLDRESAAEQSGWREKSRSSLGDLLIKEDELCSKYFGILLNDGKQLFIAVNKLLSLFFYKDLLKITNL